MLLIYTSIFTFPFIIVIFTYFNLNGSFLITEAILSNFSSLSPLATLVIFITFAVKLPIYGLHF